jgi:CHAT domain-containing protein/tetratricopeptide (TPR) repeat protein
VLRLLVSALCLTAAAGTAGDEPALVVERVAPDSASARGGLEPGDVLISWTRSEPAVPSGSLGSVFDLIEFEIEHAPRGPFVLRGRRAGVETSWTLPPTVLGLEVRPALGEPLLALHQQAAALLAAKKSAEGAERLQAAAGEARRLGDEALAAWMEARAANAFATARLWPAADEAYANATQAALRLDRPTVAAQWLRQWGDIFRRRSLTARAEESYRRALALDEKAGPESLAVARSWTYLVAVAVDRGEFASAEDSARRSLALREKLAPETHEVAHSLNQLGTLAAMRGQMAAAEEYWQRTMALRERWAPGGLEVANTLNNLGILARRNGDLAKAEACQRRALEIRERLIPGHVDIAESLNNLGVILQARGDVAAAEDHWQRALQINEAVAPEGAAVANNLSNLGLVARSRGDLPAAEDYFRRGLAIREKIAPASLEMTVSLNALGDVALDRNDLAAAEGLYGRSLSILEKVAPESGEASMTLDNLAQLARRQGDSAKALAYLQRSLAVAEKVGVESLYSASTLHSLGDLERDRGNPPAAIEHYRRALAIRQKLMAGSALEANTLHALGLAVRDTGQREEAAGYFLRALDALESQRTKLGGTHEQRAGFAAEYAAFYQDAIETEIALSRVPSALKLLERSRARSFLALLAERDLVFAGDLPPELARERRQVDAEFDRVQANMAGLNPAQDGERLEQGVSRLRELRSAQEQLAARIRDLSPRLASLQYPQPLDLDGVRAALDPGTLFLAYSTGPEQTFLFLVEPTSSRASGLSVLKIPIGEKALRDKVEAFRAAVQHVRPEAELAGPAGELYDLLLRPAQAQVAGSQRLLISPDGPLHSLPFGALVRTDAAPADKYLVQWKPAHVVASATVYAEIKKWRRPVKTAGLLVAFGDPRYPPLAREQEQGIANVVVRDAVSHGFSFSPLPASRDEVEGIASLFPRAARTYLGAQATEEQAKALGKEARYVHFACHGSLDERSPLSSALALTIPDGPGEGHENGLLQAWEIFERVRLEADVVTLSACNTALGKEMGGEGLLGLTRAFQYAGARSVLASLWAVADKSTPRLMKAFYRHLHEGRSQDEALRAAQLELIRAPGPLSHPFRWAAFQLYGDWR